MKVFLNGPKVLGNGKAGSFKPYAKGAHDLPDDVLEHEYTQALVKRGDISLTGAVSKEKSAAAGVPVKQHQEALERIKYVESIADGQHKELEKLKAEHAKLKGDLEAANALLKKSADDGKDKSGKKS